MSLPRPRQRLLALLLSFALIGLQCALPGSCAVDAYQVATCCFAGLSAPSESVETSQGDGDRCSDTVCADCQSGVRGQDDSSQPDKMPPAPCDCGLPCCPGLALVVPTGDSPGPPASGNFVRSREPPALVAVPRDPTPRPPRS